MLRSNTRLFIIVVIVWEIAVGLIYGFFLRYNTTGFNSMEAVTATYQWSLSPTSSATVTADTTLLPYPHVVLLIFVALLIVGTLPWIQDSP
jgi:hypothetical protein